MQRQQIDNITVWSYFLLFFHVLTHALKTKNTIVLYLAGGPILNTSMTKFASGS